MSTSTDTVGLAGVVTGRITLCGSARFESLFREWDQRLSLRGFIVYNLSVYPSEMGGKNWYTPEQKATLDAVHLSKIDHSDAILLINPGGYIGLSTSREIFHAQATGKPIYSLYNGTVWAQRDGERVSIPCKSICHNEGCRNRAINGPCALCYE